MYNFMITFCDKDLETARDQFGMTEAELRDFLNNLQTEADSPRGKTVRSWILNSLLAD